MVKRPALPLLADSLTPEQKSLIKGTTVWVLAEHIAKDLGLDVTSVVKSATLRAIYELNQEGSLSTPNQVN